MMIFASVVAILLIAVSADPVTKSAAQLGKEWQDRMLPMIETCSLREKVDPGKFKSAFDAGVTKKEWGCVYKCLISEHPEPLMTKNGDVQLPWYVPEAMQECVKEQTKGITDLCMKAYRITQCSDSRRMKINDTSKI